MTSKHAKYLIDLAENSDDPKIYSTPAGKTPASLSASICGGSPGPEECDASQRLSFSGEEGEEGIHEGWEEGGPASGSVRCEEDDAEQLEADPEILSAHERYRHGFQQQLMCPEEYDAFYEEPDLRSYFSQFNLTDQAVIALCRTYANYMAQKTRLAGRHGKHLGMKRQRK